MKILTSAFIVIAAFLLAPRIAQAGFTYFPFDPAKAEDSRGVAVGDLDGDGDLDVVISNSDTQSRIYINHSTPGNPSFTELTARPNIAFRGRDVTLGDVDNDGDLDIVFSILSSKRGNPSIRVWLNSGSLTPSFTAGWTSAEYDGGQDVELADFDNDGDLDIVSVSTSSRRIYENTGAGVFSLKWTSGRKENGDAQSVSVGDLDNDGDLDFMITGLLTTPAARIYRNNGNLQFALVANQPPVGGGTARGSALADLDNDGDLDIVIARSEDEPTPQNAFRNDGNMSFTLSWNPTTSKYWSPHLADYDADGRMDILFVNDNAAGQGDIVYRSVTLNMAGFDKVFETSESTRSIRGAWADFDGDSRLDFVAANTFNTVNALYLADATHIINNAPSAPIFLAQTFSGGQVTLQWDDGSDAESADPNALYYAVRVAPIPLASVTPGSKLVMSGAYGTPLLGNFIRPRRPTLYPPNQLSLRGLASGKTYYWQVRSIDSGLKASNWSIESSFIVP